MVVRYVLDGRTGLVPRIAPFPTGRIMCMRFPRHFMPGYYHLVPPGWKHLSPFTLIRMGSPESHTGESRRENDNHQCGGVAAKPYLNFLSTDIKASVALSWVRPSWRKSSILIPVLMAIAAVFTMVGAWAPAARQPK